ncbi:DUF2180 family protein [Streptomyces sp. NPDC020681]|uniref:DUF2180 family protein n=1 Tax=Streptomyces sp. NPDC020681 TaxID=3365083 RepID=UPI00379096E0
MNCYDCQAADRGVTAVAICGSCGAALCAVHARTTSRSVHRVNGMGVATLPLAARRITCFTCARAETQLQTEPPATSGSSAPRRPSA